MVPFDLLLILDFDHLHKDLFRMGNSNWPNFGEDRARIDVLIVCMNGVETVVANGNGFSAFDHLTQVMKKPGKKIWRVKAGARIDKRIRIVKDLRPGHEGHYMFAATQNMPLSEYLTVFEDLYRDNRHCGLMVPAEVAHGK